MRRDITPLLAVFALLAGACEHDVQPASDAQTGQDAGPDAQLHQDAVAPDAAVDAAPADSGTYVYTCSPVGNSTSDGFFALATFNSQVYAGQFGYGH